MAIDPLTEYPGKIAPATPSYPYGAAQNVTAPGDGTGTPWEAKLVNDILGFQQAILAGAGFAPSGSPETALASQYLDALKAIMLPRDGSIAMLAALNLGGFKATGAADGVAATDLVTKQQLDGIPSAAFSISDIGTNANGSYMQMSDGLILQWGRKQTFAGAQSKTVTLPITFAFSTPYAVVLGTNKSGVANTNASTFNTRTASTFIITNSDSGDSLGGVDWLAMGY